MSVNSLTGTLPGAWASNGGFQELSVLQLDSNFLEGGLPAPLREAVGLKCCQLPGGWGVACIRLVAAALFARA